MERIRKLKLYNLPSEDDKKGDSSDEAHKFASLFRYHFCEYIDGRDLSEGTLTGIWYPLLERSGKDTKYANELLKNARYQDWESKAHHKQLITDFETLLSGLKSGAMCHAGFGDFQERVKKALLKLDSGLVNPSITYQSFVRFKRLFVKTVRYKGNNFEIYENGAWRVTENKRNDIHDILMDAIKNCDPIGKKATNFPDAYRQFLNDFLAACDKNEEPPSVQLLFFDEPEKREAFISLMETNFDHMITAIRSNLAAKNYEKLQDEKDSDPTILPFEPQEHNTKKDL